MAVESGIRGALQAACFSLPPAGVLKVQSPSTQRVDRLLERPRYHAAGVQHVGLVDPVGRSVEVFRREEAGWLRVAMAEGAQEVRQEPFDAVGSRRSMPYEGAMRVSAAAHRSAHASSVSIHVSVSPTST